ncbi:MAG: sodium/solute symporter [Bacteroidales bacterium]|nr:sodium/solute symporter [Candidatus Physcousia equi]
MKHVVQLLFAILLFVSQAKAGTDFTLKFTPSAPLSVATAASDSLPTPAAKGLGLSATFGGVLDGDAIVAGGSNFPDLPVSQGGEKQCYDEVYRLHNGQWVLVGHLPYAAANGASVTTAKGVVCIGGSNGLGTVSRVTLLTLEEGKLQTTDLPSLPVPLTEMAAAHRDGVVYVVGGRSVDESGASVASHIVYALDLMEGKSWEALCEMPGAARLQCLAAVQSGATAPCLYVLGGYTMSEKNTTDRLRVLSDGLCLNLKTLEWKSTRPLPEGTSITGGACATSGYSHIVCVGGVCQDIFEARINDPHPTNDYFLHEPAWYRFNAQVMVYHTITDSWYALDSNPLLARAGASLISLAGNKWMLVGGETMPGVRSTDVTVLDLERETSFGWLNWVVLALYLLGMLALGYYFMKRESGADDFFRGGGRIPWWAAGISIYATMLSAITYMSIPAKAYATNWTYYPMLVTILLVSIPVVKYYLPYFRRLNITSAYEYLEMRFNLSTRLLASGLFIVFMVARMALVLYLPSLALTAVTGIDIHLCIVLMGIVTIIYCTMGGVEAVVWGDVVQGIILVGGAIFAALYLILGTEGGFGGYVEIGAANDKFQLFEWSLDYRSVTFWVAIVGGLANNLISYTSDQTVIQRYLTTKDERSAGRSIMMNGIMSVGVSVVFYVIGTGLYTFFQTHPAELDLTAEKGDAIFPYFMMSQMPAGVAGLLIAAIFAATMSTISSNINSISTAFTVDFWKRLRKQTNSDESLLRVARLSCVVSGVVGVVIALMMASWDILSLLDYFNTILGLLTGGLGGLFFMGIFCKRIQGRAALIGFLAGTLFVFWLNFFTDANLFLFGAAGMVVSVVVALLLSFRQKKA